MVLFCAPDTTIGGACNAAATLRHRNITEYERALIARVATGSTNATSPTESAFHAQFRPLALLLLQTLCARVTLQDKNPLRMSLVDAVPLHAQARQGIA